MMICRAAEEIASMPDTQLAWTVTAWAFSGRCDIKTATRAMFVTAAADRWKVPASQIAVKNSVVSHPSGKSATFAELLEDAAKVTPPKNPVLKDPKEIYG